MLSHHLNAQKNPADNKTTDNGQYLKNEAEKPVS